MEVNYMMRCCGVKELNTISSYRSAKEAMLGFCAIIYPEKERVKERWDLTFERAKTMKYDPYSYGFLGATSTGAVFDNPLQYSRFRFGIFTEAISQNSIDTGRTGWAYQYGQMFAKLIQDRKLGSLVSTEKHELNPNSGQFVKVWVWGIDHEALKKWYNKNREDKSWAQKKMSDVIGTVESAVTSLNSQPQAYAATLGFAANEPNLNNACETQASSAPHGTQTRDNL